VRVIAKGTLKDFWSVNEYRDSEQPLKSWYQEARQANWSNHNEVKVQYVNASILRYGRVVFNIAGNKYRLVVRINYDYKFVYIRFIGTHSEYDKIDAEKI
jgi:mRNA interferase HigB